jgi:enoyl-CoA hydratase/carnithine racemase
MNFVERKLRGKVVLLKLNRSVTNPINLALINDLSRQIKTAEMSKEIVGIVLTSANDKFFSIGFDIPELIELSEKDFREFYLSFNKLCIDLYSFPKPLIAAITGHAVAGGCIITLCCDYRFIARGKKLMGLNEIKLGVPLPYPADRILRQIVDDRAARRILDTGDFFPPEETLAMGLVDEVMPLEQVVKKAIGKVESIQSSSLDAFKLIKRNRTEKVEAEIRSSLTAKEDIFVEMWYTDETRRKLKAALEKFSK